jgi:hypothetical protein
MSPAVSGTSSASSHDQGPLAILHPGPGLEHLPGGGGVLDAVPEQAFDVSRISVEAPEHAVPSRVEPDGQRLDEADHLRLVQRPIRHPEYEPRMDGLLDQLRCGGAGHLADTTPNLSSVEGPRF